MNEKVNIAIWFLSIPVADFIRKLYLYLHVLAF